MAIVHFNNKFKLTLSLYFPLTHNPFLIAVFFYVLLLLVLLLLLLFLLLLLMLIALNRTNIYIYTRKIISIIAKATAAATAVNASNKCKLLAS